MLKKISIMTLALILNGCINYSGMHANTKIIQPTDIHTGHVTSKTHIASSQIKWWTKFRDPQLNNLIEQAIADSPNLKIAQARLEVAKQAIGAADTANYPKLNLTGSYAPQRVSETGTYPPGVVPHTFEQTNLGLNFKYDFDFWGKNHEALAAALTEAQASEADVMSARLILTTAVTQTYFQIQNDKTRLNLANQLLQQRQALLHLIQLRFQSGLASELDIQQAQADLENSKIGLQQLQQNLAIDQHQLAALLGKQPDTQINMSTITPDTTYTLPHVLPANLLAQRPDIMALRWRVESALHNINVAKAQFYPDINLAMSAGFETITFSKLFNRSSSIYTVTPGFNLPIFDANALRVNLGSQFAKYGTVVEQYNQQVITAMQQVADQVSILKSIQQQQRSQQLRSKAIQQAYVLTQLRYRNGLDDNLAVITAKTPYLLQRDQQLQINLQQQLAVIGLIKSLGGGY